MSSLLKAELAATCSTLGRLHKGEYLIEPECFESVKDLIRYLKRDNESHDIRRYLGESKVLQNDLIHIIKSCSSDSPELFDVTLRLLINLTTPTMLFYGEELPAEKVGRNIYLSLISYSQDYKIAFCDVDFWNKVCGKLTNLFETDWTERSADDGIQIERILMLLRNVLQVPADIENEKRPENDITIHDKVLWALRQSQILELLLFVSSNENEEQYYLNLLEIFSLILREQNPKLLAKCDIRRSTEEKSRDTDDLVKAREIEKKTQNKYLNMRNFNTTFVMKGVKSFSNNDVVCHKSLDKVNNIDINNLSKKQVRARRNRIPVESERVERRSTFSVRLFLKEFSLEFLNCGFNRFMNVVKNRLDSGKSLTHDQSYYFWAMKFFLDFAVASDSNVDLIKECLSTESFHFVQTSMDNAFEHLLADKKKTVDWVKRIHLILKAYHSLLETLMWMDCAKSPLIRAISREIKSEIFYVVEYREMTLHVLLKYDNTRFSLSYLRDLIETIHLFIKLLEEYSKQTKLKVQKVTRKKSTKRKKKNETEIVVETREEKWEKIKDDVYDILSCESCFPEIPPFDAALEIPIDDQKGMAMKNIQKFLHKGNIKDGIGLLRSARQVWPENDYFGSDGMSVEDETMALQEICLADLGETEEAEKENDQLQIEEEDEDEEDEEEKIHVVEQDFDIMDYKKRLVNKKVVEGCGILLKNYQKNSDHTNHCAIKLLHRIGWECCMPAMLFQATLFWTLLKIMKDKSRKYEEINTFTTNLLRKFRKHASKNPVIFLELLFWKEHNVALEIQHGYEPYKDKEKPKRTKKKKNKARNSDEEEIEKDMETCEISKEIDNSELGENIKNSKESNKKQKRPKKNSEGEKKLRKSRKNKNKNQTEIKENNDNDLNITNLLSNSSMISDNVDKSDSENEADDLFSKTESQRSKSTEVQIQKSLTESQIQSDESDNEPSGRSSFQKSNMLDSSDDDILELRDKDLNKNNFFDSSEGTNAVEMSEKNSKRSQTQYKPVKKSHYSQNSRNRIRKSIVLDSSDEDDYEKNKNIKSLRRFSTTSEEENITNETSLDEKNETFLNNSQCSNIQTIKSSSDKILIVNSGDEDDLQKKRKSVGKPKNFSDSSDNENEISNVKLEMNSKKEKINKKKPEDFAHSDLSNHSHTSEASSKKRSRERSIPKNILEESDRSKLKKARYIGSDSDLENYISDENRPIVIKKNKRKLVMIDSDSDEENNFSINNDDIGSK